MRFGGYGERGELWTKFEKGWGGGVGNIGGLYKIGRV